MKAKRFFALILTFVLTATMLLPAFGVLASGVTLSRSKAVLVVGQRYELKLNGTKKTPVWKTTDKKIASVNKNGVVTGVSKGTANITATLGKSVFKCKITVEAPKISIEKISVGVGRSFTLKLKGTSRIPKWQSGNTKIAAVDKNGVVKPLAKGNVLISAVLGGKKYSCKVTVTRAIKLLASSKDFTVQNSGTLVITYTGTGSLYYHISDPDVISLKWDKYWDKDEIKLFVTAKKRGSAQITITNDFNDEIRKINVTSFKVDYIHLSKSFATLYSEDQCKNFNHIKLKATMNKDAKGAKITWSSNDTTVAKVSKNGNVVAVGYGDATITAKCGNKTATCNIEVFGHPLEGIDIEFENITGDNTYYPSLRVANFSEKEKDMTFSPSCELFLDKREDDYKLVSYNPGQGLNSGFEWLVPKNKVCRCTYKSRKDYKMKMTAERVLTVVATFDKVDYLIKVTRNGYSYTPYNYGEPIKKSERFLYYGY